MKRHADRIICLVLALGCLLVFVGMVRADAPNGEEPNFLEKDEPAPTREAPELLPSSFGAMVRLVGTLFVFLLMLGGGLVLLRRWATPLRLSDRPVRLLLEEPIGQKRSICLVKVGTQVLVLGVTPSNISYLTRLEEEGWLASLEQPRGETPKFKKIWQGFRERLGGVR